MASLVRAPDACVSVIRRKEAASLGPYAGAMEPKPPGTFGVANAGGGAGPGQSRPIDWHNEK